MPVGFHAYQPSAIAATAERPSPYSRYIPPASKCRIGGGLPGAPAATEGGRLSKVPANKAGIPWGAKKQRLPPKQKFINQEPYQTLRPSGRWTHGTQMQQPANKQVDFFLISSAMRFKEGSFCRDENHSARTQSSTTLSGIFFVRINLYH